MLSGIFASIYGDTVTAAAFLVAAASSLILGGLISFTYRKTESSSQSMGLALVVLPLLVQIVIFLVNGSLGTGIAVLGAFSLIRFRSAPGSARDIVTIFAAMTVGLACGMGYVAVAGFTALVFCLLNLLFTLLKPRSADHRRELKITIPEDLDYTDLFLDLMKRYTEDSNLIQVRTTNMGSLYSLIYHIRLKDCGREKEFLDQLRCRNGNLDIVCGRVPSAKEAL